MHADFCKNHPRQAAPGPQKRPLRVGRVPGRFGTAVAPVEGGGWDAMIFKCLYIDVPDATYLTLDGRYRAGFLDDDTIWRYSRHPDYDLNEESVRRALGVKDECFAILDGDTLAAYGWYSR